MSDDRRQEVSPVLAKLIQDMTAQLRAEFGCDFSFAVCGKGRVIASANKALGMIEPLARDSSSSG